MNSRKNKIPPPEATCCACMRRKKCFVERTMPDGSVRRYENFFKSPEHCGWICAKCMRRFEEAGGTEDVPEILRR